MKPAELTPADVQRLREGAEAVLEGNFTGSFTRPSLRQYPHQWNWDSAFIAIGLRHYAPDRAVTELRSLLRGQWRNGLVPHILYPEGASSYFPDPSYWMTAQSPSAPDMATSGLTQPPLLASALRLLFDANPHDELVRQLAQEAVPRLIDWHRWLHTARDPDGTGLVAIIHPWESGMDNSPRFTEPLEAMGTVDPPPYQRRDTHAVQAEERPLQHDYDRFMHLIGVYREVGWDDGEIWDNAPFLVQDVLFNAVLYRADSDLRELSVRQGLDVTEMEGWLAASEAAFGERLWNEREGTFFDYDLRAGRQVEVDTAASFAPLYAGVCGAQQAGRLIDEHLTDSERYAPGAGSSYLLPSTSKSSEHFEPRRYWRGPVWLNVNWLVQQGLERYGRSDLAAVLRSHSLDLVARSGFNEYFDPRDGSACGAAGFSWSAALTIDLLMDTSFSSNEAV